MFNGDDPAHGQVAVKILRRELYHDDTTWPHYKAAYLAEAKRLAKATHKNVVQIHHVVEAPNGDSVLICMAFCAGGSLQAKFENGPMTLSAVRKVATDVLMGLGAMHARGMIHRDIKPANILMKNQTEAQISDFGLVTDTLMFGYASQVGYDDHIAYEVWNGKGTSVKSDIWALGMTLFRLLHGKVWYEAAPRPKDVVKFGNFAGTLRWLPHITKPWRRAIRKMLNDNDSCRYQNANQVLAALAHLPIQPVWVTSVTAGHVRWEQEKGARRVIVEWRSHTPRKHEWRAWSEPLLVGRNKQIRGSSGLIGGSQAQRELEVFFNG